MKKMKNSVKCLIAFFAMATAFCTTGVTAKAAVTLQQVDAKNDRVMIQWTQQTGVDYYGYEVATDPAFTNIVKEDWQPGSNNNDTITGLTAGSTYYVRMG